MAAMLMDCSITIRIRSQLGMWRFPGIDPRAPLESLMQRIEAEKNIPIHQQTLSSDPAGHMMFSDPSAPLDAYGIRTNGDVVHLRIDPNAAALVAGPAMVTRKKIGADGSIIAVEYEETQSKQGFRPGMPRLRDIKNTWTLNDFLELDEKFVFRFVKPKEGEGDAARLSEMCLGAHLHVGCLNDFTGSMQQRRWSQCRAAYLYGRFEGHKVRVEALYEPPQEASETGFELLEDPRQEQVATLVSLLGLTRVGWLYAHPPRETGFLMTAKEVIFAGLQQLEAANGVDKTSLVTIRMSPSEDGGASTDALQVTQQCMAMVAEGALEEDPKDLASSAINPTFTAIVEGKEGVKTVDNNRFLLNVPVLQNERPLLQVKFPPANRIGASPQSPDSLKLCITQAESVSVAVRDFNLLLYLMDFRDMFDWENAMPRICTAVVAGTELDEGDALIIRSVAGLDF